MKDDAAERYNAARAELTKAIDLLAKSTRAFPIEEISSIDEDDANYVESVLDGVTDALAASLEYSAWLKRPSVHDTTKALLDGAVRCGRKFESVKQTTSCEMCKSDDPMTPSHDGCGVCQSGSIASGGTRSHCTCDRCY